MIFLFLSILSSVSVFVLFKFIERARVENLSAIIVNYIVACLAGFFLSNSSLSVSKILSFEWLHIALLIGLLFIIMLFGIAKSTQQSGVAVTTVAVKMSVIFPIAFSIWYDAHDHLSVLKVIGIILAFVAVYLTVYTKPQQSVSSKALLLPLSLFLGIGVVDSVIKFAQSDYITPNLASVFSAVAFAFSLLIGLIILPFRKTALKGMGQVKTWGLGLLLGLANFGSIYFLLLALNSKHLVSGQQAVGSVVFGINNIGIVALSVLIGYALFKERPSRVNWTGILLSVLAIGVLAIS